MEASADKADAANDQSLYKLRHSLAHIMAQAVLQIRPDAKLGFGPPIDEGFYYDFDFGDQPITQKELKDIEKRMKKIIKQKQDFEQFDLPLEEAVKKLDELGQPYKVEYAKELAATGKAVDNTIGFYQNGGFLDMCEGPHLETTREVPKGAFKLDRIAGSYWRGDEKNPMLTRIYGLAFETPEELKDYQERREMARQRDHRKLGKELGLYVLDEEVGVGLPLWLPNGCVVRDELEKWAREVEFQGGYHRVSTPSITKGKLYERSGHLEHYKESMFPPMKLDEDDAYYLRPMNCPHHHKVFDSQMKSYRDLPYRIAEYGNCYRYEKHGSVSGLIRVRAMCMNDAHIYCEDDQVASEFEAVMAMYQTYYDHLRLGNFRVRLSLHETGNEKFVDNEDAWLRSEAMVREILNGLGIQYEEELGEAAFYGPKIDIQVKNIVGREETVSTCQLDFVMASEDRFDLTYIDREGKEARPYIIHRAPLSTHERMISFLIEMYGGAFPTWLAPTQVMLLPVGDHVMEYANTIKQQLFGDMVRVDIDDSNDSFGKKIRNAITSKIPNLWIIGGDEQEARTITWRRYCKKEQETVALDQALAAIRTMRQQRLMDNFDDVDLPLG